MTVNGPFYQRLFYKNLFRGLFSSLFYGVLMFGSWTTTWVTAQSVGELAPNFILQDSTGEPVTLNEFAGKPLLLNFWATWCPPCQEELPLFQSVTEETSELQILLINAGEGREAVVQYLEANALSLRSAVNPTSEHPADVEDTLEVAKRYRVRGMPTSFFISADGVLGSLYVGEIPEAVLAERLARIGVTWQP